MQCLPPGSYQSDFLYREAHVLQYNMVDEEKTCRHEALPTSFLTNFAADMKKTLLTITLLAAGVAAQAQRRITAYSPEMNEPVADALVWADHGQAQHTNPLGEVNLPEQFDTLHISKNGFVSIAIPASLLPDSVPLIQDYNNLGEVVVQGEYRNKQLSQSVSRWSKEARKEFELRNPITGIRFSLADAIDPKLRRIKKQKRKLEKIFKQMDADDNDPIIQAYRKAVGKTDH